MGNKRLIVAIIIVLILIVGIIAGYFYLQNSTKQAQVLQEELSNIVNLDIAEDEINMEIKTTGKYGIVEETIKNYLNDVKNIYNEIDNYCNDEELSKILSAENIEADDEELSVVKEKVEEYSAKLDEYEQKIDDIADENTIMKAIEDKKLGNYYNEIYKNVMLSDSMLLSLKNAQTEIEEKEEITWKRIDRLNDVVDFLADNTKYWSIEDGKIQFTNVNKLTKYYDLLNSTI